MPATVSYYLDHPRESGKLVKKPVTIQLVFNSSKAGRLFIKTDERIEPVNWDFKRQRVKSKSRGSLEINLYLDNLSRDVMSLYRKLRGVDVSGQEIKQRIRSAVANNGEYSETLQAGLSGYIEHLRSRNDGKTVQKFEGLKRSLNELDPSVAISDVNYAFLDRFSDFLYTKPNYKFRGSTLHPSGQYWEVRQDSKGEVIGLFDETVNKYISDLITFLKWSKGRLHYSDGFEGYKKVKRKKLDIVSLTESELDVLYSYKFESQRLQRAVDLFLLQAYTGQRRSDISRYREEDIDLDSNKWTFKMYKGRAQHFKEVTVYFEGFLARARDLFEKYSFNIPSISDQKLNEYIKEAGLIAGLSCQVSIYRFVRNKIVKISKPKHEFLTSHVARRSFISIMLDKGVPDSALMDITQHNDVRTLMRYKNKTEDQALIEFLRNSAT